MRPPPGDALAIPVDLDLAGASRTDESDGGRHGGDSRAKTSKAAITVVLSMLGSREARSQLTQRPVPISRSGLTTYRR